MADPWGVVSSTVWRSRKFRPLSLVDKAAYLYLHTSPQRSSTGLFRLPMVVMADDMNTDTATCRASIAALEDARLCDYDDADALVRITQWELRNAPQGPQDAIGRMVAEFDRAIPHRLTYAAFLAFAVHILHRAAGTDRGGEGWKVTDIRAKMEDMIFHRLKAYATRNPADFAAAFPIAEVDPQDTVLDMLWHTLSDTVSDTLCEGYGIPTPIHRTRILDQRTQIREQRSEIKEHGTRNKDQKKEGSARGSAAAPPDPIEGDRSGLTQAEQVQAEIAALTARATGRK